MERTIVRDVRDIAGSDRRALGEPLRDNQRLIVQVLTLPDSPKEKTAAAGDAYADLPEWCDILASLSDDEIADIERTTHRRLNLTREPS